MHSAEMFTDNCFLQTDDSPAAENDKSNLLAHKKGTPADQSETQCPCIAQAGGIALIYS